MYINKKSAWFTTGTLKIDIEGSEKEVFSHNTEWLNKVGLIFIEFHDRKKNESA